MKVQVIGCSTSWTSRPMSSYCLNDEILIDCGEGTAKEYLKLDFDSDKVKDIFITHFHFGHIFVLAYYFCKQRKIFEATGEKRLTVYGPEGLKKHLKLMQYFVFGEKSLDEIQVEDFLNIVELSDGDEVQIDSVKVKTFRLEHGNVDDNGYVFEVGDKKIGFSGDCTYTTNVENFVKDCDICFLECCSLKTSEKHLGYDKFKEIENKYPSCRFLAIHSTDNLYLNQDKYDMEFAISGKTYQF